MNKKTFNKAIFIGLGSLVLFVICLILFIKSYEIYKDEYGVDVSFNENYGVMMVVSIILLGYFIYRLYLEYKGSQPQYSEWAGLVTSSIISFYSLGKFFKAMFKAINKNTQFDFASNQIYLYMGILMLTIVMYFTFDCIEKHWKKN